MVRLIARWKLEKAGCPPELEALLDAVARRVRDREPNTLMYSVHLHAAPPNDSHSDQPPMPIPGSEQTEVVFVECYRDAKAFSDHVKGPVFTEFLQAVLQYFEADPERPGWPKSEVIFLEGKSAFVRTLVDQCA